MKRKSIISAAVLSTALLFSSTAAVTVTPTHTVAATQSSKETLLKNQTDLYNYFSFDAVMLKNFEEVVSKLEKLPQDDEVKFVNESKKHISKLKSLTNKLKKFPTKNKEILAMNNAQVKLISEAIDFYEFSLGILESKDETRLPELEERYNKFITNVDKHEKDFIEAIKKAMTKYRLKINSNISYIAITGNGEKISLKTFTYTVNKGDDLSKIAKAYGVKSADLKKWNKLKSSKLRQGQKLKITIKL